MSIEAIYEKYIKPDIPTISAIAGRSIHIGFHYAKLIYGGAIVAQASNSFSPVSNISILKTKKGRSKFSIHAEYNVIQAYLAMLLAKRKIRTKNKKKIPLGKLRDCTLILYSATKSGKLRESKPCTSCFELMNSLGIKDIYYSNKEGQLVYSLISELNDTCQSSGNRPNWND